VNSDRQTDDTQVSDETAAFRFTTPEQARTASTPYVA
jgi:hypothetical protein